MKQCAVDKFRNVLRGLNALLAAGIILFVFLYVVPADVPDPLEGFKWGDPSSIFVRTESSRDEDFKILREYFVDGPGSPTPPLPERALSAVLVGTVVAEKPEDSAAVLQLEGSKEQVAALCGRPIRRGSDPVPELAGWTLAEVGDQTAVFRSGRRTEVLRLKEELVGRPAPVFPGFAAERYDSRRFQTRLVQASPGRMVWQVDPDEVRFASENIPAIVEESSVSLHSEGLQLAQVAPGSILAARGLRSGDVVRSVDGRPLRGLEDLRRVFGEGQMTGRDRLSLVVLRGGRNVVLEYILQR